MRSGRETDRDTFFDDFTRQFFTAGDELKVTDAQRHEALASYKQSNQDATLSCMEAFGTTDFRGDLSSVTVPTLVIQGDSDGIVPFDGSGKRTYDTIVGSELVVVEGASHGFNVSHSKVFNAALLAFFEK